MNIPFKSIKVGAWQIAIKRMSKENAKSNWGLYFPHTHEIHVLSDYPTKQKAAEIIVHELAHVILEERGIMLGKQEEVTVTEFTKGLLTVLSGNPDVAKWLLKCVS